jgi:hypothetical protein
MHKLLESVIINPSDRQAIDKARARVHELQTLAAKVSPERPDRSYRGLPHCYLSVQAGERLAEFEANPTQETADLYHAAAVRAAQADMSAGPLQAALGRCIEKESASLAPITLAITDSAVANLETRRKAALVLAGKQDVVLADMTDQITRKADHLAAQLQGQRAESQSDPLGWLNGHDLASHTEPEPAEQPAKPTPPPVKSYRGKIRLDKPEVPQADDVLSGLTDPDEIDLEDPLALLGGN